MAAQLRSVPQLAMDERVVDDKALEAALEKRLRASDDLAEVRGVFKDADTAAKAEIAKLDLSAEAPVRVGRFRITKSEYPARSVTFDTEASSRVRIAVVEE